MQQVCLANAMQALETEVAGEASKLEVQGWPTLHGHQERNHRSAQSAAEEKTESQSSGLAPESLTNHTVQATTQWLTDLMMEAGRHSNDPKDSTTSWITKLNHELQSFTAASMEKNTAGRDEITSEAEVDDWYLKWEMSILAGDHRLHQRMPKAERSKLVGYADQYFKLLGPELETDVKRQQEFLRLTH